MSSRPFDTLLFDLDGTLIDSVPDLTLALHEICRRYDLPAYDEATVRNWVGNGSAMLVKRALSGTRDVDETALEETRFEEAHALFLEAYQRHLCSATRPYPGVHETLEHLQADGYAMAVVTNKPARFLPELLERLELASFFDYVSGGDTHPVKKPDPLPLLAAARALKSTPKRCVMIGDSRNDLLAAQRCDMARIGVTYGYHCGVDLNAFAPMALVDRFDALPQALEKEKA
jgi:phosphoglycolate phosphatase